jgi:hypothetical protein
MALIKNVAWNTTAHASAIQKLRSRVLGEPQRTEPAVVRSAVSPILSVPIPQLDPNAKVLLRLARSGPEMINHRQKKAEASGFIVLLCALKSRLWSDSRLTRVG